MLNELKKLVISQKAATLPAEASALEFQALHTALTNYDQVVSQAVIQILQGIPFDYPTAQISNLRGELDQLFARASSGREVDTYLRYRQRLDQMSDLAQQVAQDSPAKE